MEMKKEVLYISYVRFPSERAHSVYVAKVCESFLNMGIKCKLLLPKRLNVSKDSPTSFYNLKKHLNIVYLPSVDLFQFISFKKVAHRIGVFTFTFFVCVYVVFNTNKHVVILTNDAFIALVLTFFRKKTVWEVHDYPKKNAFLYRKVLKRSWKIITNNKQKKISLTKDYNLDDKKILAQHNGISVDQFDLDITKKEARKKLNLPLDEKIIVYTGSLQIWKGVYVLANIARFKTNIQFYFVGGFGNDKLKFIKKYKNISNVHVVSSRPHSEIPIWQKSADILVLPNTGKDKISKYFTSPMKLFEYMASKRPIIASNLPSVVEIIDKNVSVLVDSDNENDLISAIEKILNNSEFALKISNSAFEEVKKYSWNKRAERVIHFLIM